MQDNINVLRGGKTSSRVWLWGAVKFVSEDGMGGLVRFLLTIYIS